MVELPVEEYAHGLGVSLMLLHDARKLAKGHFAWMYLDLQRHSWYEEETIKESVRAGGRSSSAPSSRTRASSPIA